MTTNPTRPATGGVIATTWGLSVADTVVRRYPNAAARDADLTGHTAADLTGQVVVLTGTGEVLQYAGPLMGWRKPWNMPWGSVIYGEALNGVTGDGSVRDLVVLTPAAPHPAGRLVRMTSTLFAGEHSRSRHGPIPPGDRDQQTDLARTPQRRDIGPRADRVPRHHDVRADGTGRDVHGLGTDSVGKRDR